MTRILFGLVLLTVSPLGAQTLRVGLAYGGKVALEGSSANRGSQVLGVLEVGGRRSPVAMRVDGVYGGVRDNGGVRSRLTGGSANLVYHVGAPAAPERGYLLAGLGVYHVSATFDLPLMCPDTTCSRDRSSTSGGYGVGAGMSFGTGPIRLVSEARYINISVAADHPTTFFLISAGISFGN